MAGLVGMLPQDFRRTAVRILARAGVPRSVAVKLVGHKTEAMYRRYATVSPRDLTEGAAKLAILREGGNSGRKLFRHNPGHNQTQMVSEVAAG
jgi:integrase